MYYIVVWCVFISFCSVRSATILKNSNVRGCNAVIYVITQYTLAYYMNIINVPYSQVNLRNRKFEYGQKNRNFIFYITLRKCSVRVVVEKMIKKTRAKLFECNEAVSLVNKLHSGPTTVWMAIWKLSVVILMFVKVIAHSIRNLLHLHTHSHRTHTHTK